MRMILYFTPITFLSSDSSSFGYTYLVGFSWRESGFFFGLGTWFGFFSSYDCFFLSPVLLTNPYELLFCVSPLAFLLWRFVCVYDYSLFTVIIMSLISGLSCPR